MKIAELFEAVEKDIGTLEIVGDGDALTVRCTAKSGPMLPGLYWVWSAVGKKKGVTTTMMISKMRGKPTPTELSSSDGLKILDKRPTKLTFTGVSREDLQAAVDKAIAKVQKEMKSSAKYKTEAPKRKVEASKYQAEKRKKDLADYAEKYGKGTWGRVTYRQEGGDDGYAYVVRVDGRAKYNGLTLRQATYEKEQAVNDIAKREKLGKYAEKVTEGLQPGQKAWKQQMIEKGATSFKRDTHGGGTVDRIVAYSKNGDVVGGFNLKAGK